MYWRAVGGGTRSGGGERAGLTGPPMGLDLPLADQDWAT